MYIWNPVLECDDDENNPTVWATEVNSEKYGKYVWICDTGDGFEITSSYYDEMPIKVCKSLTSAKRWVSINIR